MKKRVRVLDDSIFTKDIKDSSHVGILFGGNVGGSEVVRGKDGQYMSSSDNDYKSCWTKPSKREYVEQFLRLYPDLEVFVFDSRKELFEWLISTM